MGKCTYCGENAGFLKTVHQACTERHNDGWRSMLGLAAEAAQSTFKHESLVSELGVIAESSFIPKTGVRDALIDGWEGAVTRFLDDNVLSEDEEARLTQYMERFSLSRNELDARGFYTRMVRGATIREVIEGKIPSQLKVQGNLPFNFQKSEDLVWLFQDVPYYQVKTRSQRVGGSQGVSVRIARGLYYRVGEFKSHSVETTANEFVENGLLGITTKHIYFAGPFKKFRVPYTKMVAIESFSDGFGFTRDAMSAKPQNFITGDGWFTYNLIANLNRLQSK